MSLNDKFDSELEYDFYFKPGFIENLCLIKNFKEDKDLADAMGISKSYLSQLKSNKKPATKDVLIATAALVGNLKDGWWQPFEIRPTGAKKPPSNSPQNNYKKFQGLVEYEQFSPYRRDPEDQI